MLKQLQIGEAHPSVTKADNPVHCFFSIMVHKGGLTRPPGFEFPEEKAERFKQQELLKQQELIASMEKARQKEKELADKEAFLMFIADHDAVKVALDEIAQGFNDTDTKSIG